MQQQVKPRRKFGNTFQNITPHWKFFTPETWGGVDEAHCCDTSRSFRALIGQHSKVWVHLASVVQQTLYRKDVLQCSYRNLKFYVSLITCELHALSKNTPGPQISEMPLQWRVRLQHTSPVCNLSTLRLRYQVPKINTTAAEQLPRAMLPLLLPYKRPCHS